LPQQRLEINLDPWKTYIALAARMPLLLDPDLHYIVYIQGTPHLIAELQEAFNEKNVVYSLREVPESPPED